MSGLFKEIPQYLREEYQLTATVMFTAFFSLVFMLFSIPFSHNAWFELATGRAFGYTVAFFAIGLLVIIFSKRLMYLSRNKIRMNYLQYVLWNFAEVVAICLLYALFSIRGNASGVIRLQDDSFVSIFFNALLYCFTSLVVPYVIAGMYFAIIDKNNTIRLMNYSDTVSDRAGNIRRRQEDNRLRQQGYDEPVGEPVEPVFHRVGRQLYQGLVYRQFLHAPELFPALQDEDG